MNLMRSWDRPIPLLCRASVKAESHGLWVSKITAASKRIDTNVSSVAILLPRRSPYCSPNPPLLIGSEGRIRGAQISNRAELRKFPSTTSNLLFGNLQHRVDENSWVPVHGVRRGRIKLLAGSPGSIKGWTIHVPIPVGRCGLDSVFCLQHDSDFNPPFRSSLYLL